MTDKLPETGAVSSGGRNGHPTDPSPNVLDLVEAAVKRLNDVGGAQDKRQDDLRQLESYWTRRAAETESTHLREIMAMSSAHSIELREAEAKRIDAIRAVDVGAVQVAADRATAAANVLSTTVTETAENNRTLVAAAATALAEQTSQIIKPINDRLTSLEKSQNELSGRTTATDPQALQLSADVRALTKAIAEGAGAKQGATEVRTGQKSNIGMIVGVAGVFLALLSVGVAVAVALAR